MTPKNPDSNHKAVKTYFLLNYLYSKTKIREAVLEMLGFYRSSADKVLIRINQVKPLLECSDEILSHLEKCLKEGDFYTRRGHIFYSRSYAIDAIWNLVGLGTIATSTGLASWIILQKGKIWGLDLIEIWGNQIIRVFFLLITVILAMVFLLELGKFLVFKYLSRKNLALIAVSLKVKNISK